MCARARTLVLCLAGSLLVLLLTQLSFTAAQETQDSSFLSLPGFFTRRDCGRKGLCPYVRRLIPHLYGGAHGVDYGGGLRRSQGGEPPSLCGNLCTNDNVCPGHQKCCPTNCGYACFDPVFVVDN